MTVDEANALAIRYKNIWRGGPATEELREHFTEMDAGRARNALNACAQRLDHPPSIAQLWREYEATRSPLAYGWDHPADTGPVISPDEAYAHNPDLAAWRARHREGRVTTALRLNLDTEPADG